MKKKSSIIKLTLIGVALAIGIVLSVFSFKLPFGFYNYKSFASSIKLGLDLKGGIYAVYDTNSDGVDNFQSKLEGTQSRLQDLLVDKGYSEAVVTIEDNTRLRVEVPDVDDPKSIFTLIGKPAQLLFYLGDDNSSEPFMSGKNVVSAEGYYDSQQAKPVVSLVLDDEGRKAFGKVTTDNVGKNITIYSVTEGEDPSIVSQAKINEGITTGRAQITMSGSDATAAKELATQIMSGTFDVELTLLSSDVISPTLGEQALKLGIIAGAIGLFLVVAFLIWRYRLFGVVAAIALAIYAVLMLFFLAVFPWVQLTLPGIAGIILSLGMAVDGNVIIYERIRDEYAAGKSILASLNAGFKKAMVAIFDSNITTVIAAIVLIIFGTGTISGFGVTLLIGILLSMFTSLLVTRGLCKYFTAINSTNAKAYGLKRGKDYVETEPEVEEIPSEKGEEVNA